MSDDHNLALTVRILGKEYRVACSPNEEDGLVASARYLDDKMREIRNSGKVIGTDRIAVMAALNIAHELLQQQHSKESVADNVGLRMRQLRDRVEIALNQSNQLEL